MICIQIHSLLCFVKFLFQWHLVFQLLFSLCLVESICMLLCLGNGWSSSSAPLPPPLKSYYTGWRCSDLVTTQSCVKKIDFFNCNTLQSNVSRSSSTVVQVSEWLGCHNSWGGSWPDGNILLLFCQSILGHLHFGPKVSPLKVKCCW